MKGKHIDDLSSLNKMPNHSEETLGILHNTTQKQFSFRFLSSLARQLTPGSRSHVRKSPTLHGYWTNNTVVIFLNVCLQHIDFHLNKGHELFQQAQSYMISTNAHSWHWSLIRRLTIKYKLILRTPLGKDH